MVLQKGYEKAMNDTIEMKMQFFYTIGFKETPILHNKPKFKKILAK